jgi:hypothetical protein
VNGEKCGDFNFGFRSKRRAVCDFQWKPVKCWQLPVKLVNKIVIVLYIMVKSLIYASNIGHCTLLRLSL